MVWGYCYNIPPLGPCRCPKGHEAPAGVVAAVHGGGPGQCFVQLSDYKMLGTQEEEKHSGWLVCRLNGGIWFMPVGCMSVCMKARHVCFGVSVCD